VLRAAGHWGSESSVINNPLGEPGRTQLYVGLLSTWGSVDGECLVSSHFMGRAPLMGTLKDILTKALEMGVCFYRGPVLGNMGERSFPRAFKRRVKFLFIITFMRNSRDM